MLASTAQFLLQPQATPTPVLPASTDALRHLRSHLQSSCALYLEHHFPAHLTADTYSSLTCLLTHHLLLELSQLPRGQVSTFPKFSPKAPTPHRSTHADGNGLLLVGKLLYSRVQSTGSYCASS